MTVPSQLGEIWMQRRARREDNVETPERAICEPGTVRGHQKLGGKERTDSPQRDLSCRHLGCRFVAPRSEGQLCHLFKPPRWWHFVVAAPGN